VGCHGVGQFAEIVDGRHFGCQVFGNAFVGLGVFFEMVFDRTAQGRGFGHRLGGFGHGVQRDLKKVICLDELAHPGADLAFDQGLDRAVGQAQQLQHRADHPHPVDVFFRRIVDIGRSLGGQEDVLVRRVHGMGKGLHGLGPSHEQGRHHLGEYHNVAQGQQGQYLDRLAVIFVFKKSSDIYHRITC